MKTKYTKKQIQESIKHWQKVLESMHDSIYPMFVNSLDQLAENETMLDEGDPLNVDYIALENNSPLGKIAFNLLQQFLLKHGGNKIDSAQFCSCKSMKKLLNSLKIEFKDDIERWMSDEGVKSRAPHAILQQEIKNALQDSSTCFVIMHVKTGYNPNDYDEDTRASDHRAASTIINNIIAATGLPAKQIPSGLLLSNGSQYLIAAF